MTENENLLTILTEECAELSQAVSKALRFGMDSYHPYFPKQTNEHNIMVEYYQLVAVMEMLWDKGVVHRFNPSDEAMVKISKKLNVERYREVSKNSGCIKE